MRREFVEAMLAHFAAEPRAVFVTGDLGFRALEPLRDAFPDRFLNAGVAEQNMVGLCAGLALAGHRPWAYSIAPFAVYRCLEQIRNDLCLHGLPVRIVGNGGGYTYGIMGATHHALEDLGALKALPRLQLFFPGTAAAVTPAVAQAAALDGPCYLRLAHAAHPGDDPPLAVHPDTLTAHYRSGRRLTVVAVGHAVQLALAALRPLANAADIYGVTRFPLALDADADMAHSVAQTGRLLLLDEHYAAGSIAESLQAALPRPARSRLLAATYRSDQRYGSAAFHLAQAGMAPDDVLAAARDLAGT